MIEFRDVSFSYGEEARARRRAPGGGRSPGRKPSPDDDRALSGISFTLGEGELLGIAGHTGSGKSTLIQLAGGLLQPTAGRVLANGIDLSGKNAASLARRDVGVVFQYPERQLFAATVLEDIAFGPRNLGLSAEEAERRARKGLELVYLDPEELGGRSPFSLSGGQQRRVALAGVLAMRPGTLVLDEPAAGLDPRARHAFLDLLRELHETENLAVAVASHDMDDLAGLCGRILVLNQGELHALGTPEEVFSDEEGMRAIGLGAPQAVSFANELSARGVALPSGSGLPSVESLADAIAARYHGMRTS